MSDGYVPTYQELIETTDWDKYGRGKDPRCANCMAHCGYEPTAVLATMGSLKESLRAVARTVRLHRGVPRTPRSGRRPATVPGRPSGPGRRAEPRQGRPTMRAGELRARRPEARRGRRIPRASGPRSGVAGPAGTWGRTWAWWS